VPVCTMTKTRLRSHDQGVCAGAVHDPSGRSASRPAALNCCRQFAPIPSALRGRGCLPNSCACCSGRTCEAVQRLINVRLSMPSLELPDTHCLSACNSVDCCVLGHHHSQGRSCNYNSSLRNTEPGSEQGHRRSSYRSSRGAMLARAQRLYPLSEPYSCGLMTMPRDLLAISIITHNTRPKEPVCPPRGLGQPKYCASPNSFARYPPLTSSSRYIDARHVTSCFGE